jgi:hypothetical protein
MLHAVLAIPKTAKAGQHLTFTVLTTTTPSLGTPAPSSIQTIVVAGKVSPSPKPSASSPGSGSGSGSGSAGGRGTPGGAGSTGVAPIPGVGATLPSGLGLPGSGTNPVPALGGLPGPVAGSADPGATFPKVSPEPNLAPSPVALPGPQRARVANVSAEFPLDGRLIGIQVAGLAVLAAAVAIGVARLSLRRHAPRHGKGTP